MAYRYILFLLGIVCLGSLYAQNGPTSAGTMPAIDPGIVNPVPAAYSNPTINYIRSWVPLQPYSQEADVISSSRTVNQVNKVTQYVDGLGRPLQTVNWQASPNQKDMVSAHVYDAFGREAYQYLPYTSTSNTGVFKTDPFSEQQVFYSNIYPSQQPAYTGEQVYYGQTIFEASPLNRPVTGLAPGNSWGGSGRGISASYEINTDGEVLQWDYPGNSTGGIPVTSKYYGAGQLYRTVTTDEQGHRVVEYKDKDGREVLKKVELPTAANPSPDITSHTDWLCTYYVYDNFGLLQTIIPPKATEQLLSNGNTISAGVLKELCFSYNYDSRNRMVVKQVPGAAPVSMVYDQRDRLVFTQDGNMHSKGWWMATLYDDLNRPVETAMLTGYGGSQADLQTYVNGVANNTTIDTTNGRLADSIPANLVVNKADAQRTDYEASHQVRWQAGFHFKATAGSHTHAGIVTGSGATGFTSLMPVNQNPIPPGGTLIALTLTYYDDYSQTHKTYDSSNNHKLGQGNNPYAETLSGAASAQTKGLPTVTRVRVIENDNDLTKGQWLETASFYDDKARVIQIQSTNYKGGLDIVTNRYDFTGKPVSTYSLHNNAAGNTHNLRTNTTMDYDAAGRLLRVTKTINDDPGTTRIITRNSYDDLGQLLHKQIGQKNSSDTTAMESDDYRYNIRGWLKGINAPQSPAGGVDITVGKWFAMDLSYDWGYTHNQYNGNIAGMRWQSAGDQAERSYGYGYDAANRLLYGDFNQHFNGTWAKADPTGNLNIDFSMQMGNGIDANTAYDANGNILAMKQTGLQLNSSHTIDSLSYQYNANSNKLSSVTDGITADNGLGDFTDKNTSGDDYGYDVNGNMVTDKNKRLNGIQYNYLNLPWQIAVQNADGSNKGTINYIYDATGNKLAKRVKEKVSAIDTLTTITDYINVYVYTNNLLQFFGQEEGRVRYVYNLQLNTYNYSYDYFLKDHLGNIRTVLTEEARQDIYPAATLENGSLTTDTFYYNIQADNIRDTGLIPGYSIASGVPYVNNNGITNPNPVINTSAPSQKMYILNEQAGSNNGLGVAVRVMARDTVSIFGKSYYHLNSGQTPNNGYPVTSALLSFLNAFSGSGIVAAGNHGVTGSTLNNSSLTTDGLTGWLNDSVPTPTGKPKAYINWILFDDQFKPVGSSSGFSAVNNSPDIINTHTGTANITKNGYLYVYCSNESDVDVFFDNLQVVHARGPLLEETHYYPFGLTMVGISSKAAGSLENKYKYNDGNELQHQEFSDGSGLELYDANFRMYDPQIGRFHQIDPFADIFEDQSPYSFANNNPTLFNDPLGLAADTAGKGNIYAPEVVVTTTVKPKPSPAPEPSAPTSVPAGLPLPISPYPLTPVQPLAPVVPMFEPLPIIGPITLPGLLGTVGGVLIPIPTGRGADQVPRPDPLFRPGAPDSKPDDDGYIRLYRGVNSTNPEYAAALLGVAIPLGLDGGHNSARLHNFGDTHSIFTSWSISPVVAARAAVGINYKGVILEKLFKISQTRVVPSPDIHGEGEILIPGIVTGATVHSPYH